MTNMITVPQYTFFAKATGVEIKAFSKQPDSKGNEEGAVMLRFFGFKEKASVKPISFQMTPPEAYHAFAAIMRILSGRQPADQQGKIRHSFIHKKQVGNVEQTSSVVFEYWENNGRSGYGIGINRTGMDPISVSIGQDDFGFMAEFLKNLSVRQAYQRFDENARRQQPTAATAQPTTAQPVTGQPSASAAPANGQRVAANGVDQQAPPAPQQSRAYVGAAHDPFDFSD